MSLKSKILIVAALVAFGALSRLLPHAWNTTPVTAIALFISAYIGVRYSLASVMGTMLISDIIIGFYAWPILLAVYGSFLLAAFMGILINKYKTVQSLFITTIGSSLVFFVITNWAVWQFGTMYTHSFSGLMQAYLMAIPFFKNALFGDLIYTGLLFGTAYVTTLVLKKQKLLSNI
jgi:hypothetical protein